MESLAIKELQQLYIVEQQKKCPNFPPSYFVKLKTDTKTANGLTSAIVKYIDLKGGFASRINSAGVYDSKLGKHRPGTTKKGFSDIQACYKGVALYVEVKIGRDRQSDYQRDFQKKIIATGGLYFIAKDFESFHEWFNNTLNKAL